VVLLLLHNDLAERRAKFASGFSPFQFFWFFSRRIFFSFPDATGRKDYAFVVLTKTLLQNFDLPLHCARIEDKLLMAYYTGLQLFQERKSSKKSVDEGK